MPLDRENFFHMHVYIMELDFLLQERYLENNKEPHGVKLLSSIKLIVQWSNSGLNPSHSKSNNVILGMPLSECLISYIIISCLRAETSFHFAHFIPPSRLESKK